MIVADAVSAAAEEPPRRRGIFGLRRRSKLPVKPLTHCENCGAPLTGEFCAQCGQHAIDYRRSIFRVLLDAADSFLNWDTKFLHTVNQLLIHPWQLTNDFNAGRRARYVHPLRLYLIASIVFFLLARAIDWDSQGPIQLTAQDRTEMVAALSKMIEPDSPLNAEQRAQVELARVKLAEAEGALTAEQRTEVRNAFKAYIKSEVRKTLSTQERVRMATMMARIPKIPGPGKEVTLPVVPEPCGWHQQMNDGVADAAPRRPINRQLRLSSWRPRRSPRRHSISRPVPKGKRRRRSARGWKSKSRKRSARTAARRNFSSKP